MADPVALDGRGGTAVLTDYMLAYVGGLEATELHAHHAVQIVVALGEPLGFRDGQGRWVRGAAAVIPRDVRHAHEQSRGPMLVVWISPEHAWGRRLGLLATDSHCESWVDAASSLCQLRGELADKLPGELESAATQLVAQLAGALPSPRPLPPAIQRLLAELPSHLDGDVRLPALARIVGLSSGRLGHLFSKSVGIPLRPYVLWLRMQRVMLEVRRGASLTTAAHAAGFTDSAHLANTYRRMFGVTPSGWTGALRWLTPKAGGEL
jgi:AraC-like DNA-binding protein